MSTCGEPTPGRLEQMEAERAACVNAARMKLPLIVIGWPDHRGQSFLGWRRAVIAQRPVTMIFPFVVLGVLLGVVVGIAV